MNDAQHASATAKQPVAALVDCGLIPRIPERNHGSKFAAIAIAGFRAYDQVAPNLPLRLVCADTSERCT